MRLSAFFSATACKSSDLRLSEVTRRYAKTGRFMEAGFTAAPDAIEHPQGPSLQAQSKACFQIGTALGPKFNRLSSLVGRA
jgi:hypothetical protein